MRLDKYLKVSRIIKRRTVAAEACDLGRVSINGKVAKPSSEVKVGDKLDLLMSGKHHYFKVLAIQEYTKKDDAALMYEILPE